MFCPNCHAEYREGFSECSDCHVALVEQLPEDSEGEPQTGMVEIFQSTNPLQISLAKSLLEKADLEYTVTGEDLRYLLGAGGGGLAGNPTTGPARIIVRQPDLAAARQVLEEMPDEQTSDEAE